MQLIKYNILMLMTSLLFLSGCQHPPLRAVPDQCSSAQLESTTSTSLHALQGSLFSEKLYVQGDPNWKPTPISFLVKSSGGLPLSGCLVKIYPETKEDGQFFFKSAEQFSDASGKVTGWWVSGKKEDAKLRAVIVHNPTATISLTGKVSAEAFRNLVPAPSLRYGVAGQSWQSIKVLATPLHSADATYFQLANWNGGYVGLQQTDNEAKKLNFTIWRTAEGIPTILEDHGANCKLNEESAEGTFVQCFTDYPWSVGSTYTFQITATPAGNSLDYSLHVNNVSYATIRVPVSLGFHPSMPAAFVEQFAHDQYSCLAAEERSIKLQASYTKPNETTELPITSTYLSRPYDPAYGHGSLCFNYAYGTLDDMALLQTSIQPGFFISAGGNRLISEPADGAVGLPGKSIVLPIKFYYINTQAEMDSLKVTEYFEELLARNHNLSVNTSDRNWLPTFTLPEHVAEGSRFNLSCYSAYATSVMAGGVNHPVAQGENIDFIFANGGWVLQQKSPITRK